MSRGGAFAFYDFVAASEQQFLDDGRLFGATFDVEVGLGRFLGEQPFLGLLNRFEDWRVAVGILVDAHGQVNLARVRVHLERFAQTQYGVRRSHFQ